MRCLLAVIACFLLVLPASADPSAPAGQAKPATLETALTALTASALPQGTLIITVDPGDVQPAPAQPPDQNGGQADQAGYQASPPPDVSTLQGVLLIYDRAYQPFGPVAALTAPTMTELTLDPRLLNLNPIDIAPGDAMKLLLGSLTKSQWQQVASGGLAVADLDDDQQALLRTAANAPIDVVPSTIPYEPPRWSNGEPYSDYINQTVGYDQQYSLGGKTITPDMVASARIEAYLATSYALPIPGQQNNLSLADTANTGIPGLYQISMLSSSPQMNQSLSDLVLPKVQNTLKPGDLNWNSRSLGVSVSVAGAKTVGDLVSRVAQATGLELYCDPHYAGRPILLLGDTAQPERARELLEALCVCVSGTFRAVGPAYVLTDDLLGVASRRSLLEDLATSWQNRLRRLSEEADQHLNDDDWTKSLGFYSGDPNALAPDQLKGLQAAHGAGDLTLNFSELPQATQTALGQKMNRMAAMYPGDPYYTGIQGAIGPSYKTTVMLQMRIVLDVPDVGPVALDSGQSYLPVYPGHMGRYTPGPPPQPTGPQKPATYPAVLAGVIAAPKTAAEARALVDEMAGMGLHLLYCEAFTAGKAYESNPGIAPDSADAAAALPAAIEEGKAKGVKVVAVVDVFSWGKTDLKSRLSPLPRGVAEDQTITLETGTASLIRRIAEQAAPDYVSPPSVTDRWVSPLDRAVQEGLAQLVGAVAATPGLAGLAFQDAAPPGYLSDQNPFDPRTTALGYAPAARLAFLRAHGVDPIDIDDNIFVMALASGNGPGAMVNLDIPSFDTLRDTPGGRLTPIMNMEPAWKKARTAADEDEMASLYAIARGASATLPLYLRDPVIGLTFAPWNDPKMPISTQPVYGSPDLSDAPPRSMFALDYGPIHGYAYSLPDVLGSIQQMTAKAKTPVGLLFDLATEPSPDGPIRDLQVIGEHVTFVAHEKPSAQKGASGPSQ